MAQQDGLAPLISQPKVQDPSTVQGNPYIRILHISVLYRHPKTIDTKVRYFLNLKQQTQKDVRKDTFHSLSERGH